MAHSWYVLQGWRWMFGLTAVPSLLFFLGMFAVPESPRWLAKNGQPDLARDGAGPDRRRRTMPRRPWARSSRPWSTKPKQVRFRELLDPKMTGVLVLGVVLAVFQQWCGINVIFNYAEEIFQAAGYDISDVLKNIAWTGSVNFVFTLRGAGRRRPRRAKAADAGRARPGWPSSTWPWAAATGPHVHGLADAAAGAGRHRLLRACRWRR